MRLTLEEVAAIKTAAGQAFGPAAVVRLFGSRLDDSRRGGDIDLHIALPSTPSEGAAGSFRQLLERHVGERDYDILVSFEDQVLSPVHRKALTEGVVL